MLLVRLLFKGRQLNYIRHSATYHIVSCFIALCELCIKVVHKKLCNTIDLALPILVSDRGYLARKRVEQVSNNIEEDMFSIG